MDGCGSGDADADANTDAAVGGGEGSGEDGGGESGSSSHCVELRWDLCRGHVVTIKIFDKGFDGVFGQWLLVGSLLTGYWLPAPRDF